MAPATVTSGVKPWETMTSKQRHMVETMCWLHYQLGRSATIREIMQEVGVNGPNGVYCHLVLLERYGWVKKHGDSAKWSNWRVVRTPLEWVLLPGGGIVPREDVAGLIARLQREALAS